MKKSNFGCFKSIISILIRALKKIEDEYLRVKLVVKFMMK